MSFFDPNLNKASNAKVPALENATPVKASDGQSTDNQTVISQKDREIFEIPAGCLGDKVLQLACKSPTEAKFYSFSMANRMLADDQIIKVEVKAAEDSKVEADKIDYSGQSFKVRLKGGVYFHNVAVKCQITTSSDEVLDFVCLLPIRPEGILAKGIEVIMAMGATGTGIQSVAQKKDGTLVFTMSDGTTKEVRAGYEQAQSLPQDFILNGGLYLAPDGYVTGSKVMPAGLWLNGNVVVTDGTVIYQDTWNNGGLLCATS